MLLFRWSLLSSYSVVLQLLHKSLGIVLRAPITIGITVTLHSKVFFLVLWSTWPSFHFLSILLLCLPGQQSPQFIKFSFILLIITRSGRLAKIRWSVSISKFQGGLCVSFSKIDSGLFIVYLFVWSNLFSLLLYSLQVFFFKPALADCLSLWQQVSFRAFGRLSSSL